MEMKKILILFFVNLISSSVFSQVTLTQEQYEKLPNEVKTTIELENKTEEVSEYVSWGKEIGIAIDSALSSVEEHLVNLSETQLGHTVIFLVIWKFIYKDVIGLFIGLMLLSIMIWLLCKMFKIGTTDVNTDEEKDTRISLLLVLGFSCLLLFVSSMIAIF